MSCHAARLDTPGLLQHVIVRGIERRKIFRDDIDRENLLARLATLLPDTHTACYAWSFLGNHAHFLFRSGPRGIANLMRPVRRQHEDWASSIPGLRRQKHRVGPAAGIGRGPGQGRTRRLERGRRSAPSRPEATNGRHKYSGPLGFRRRAAVRGPSGIGPKIRVSQQEGVGAVFGRPGQAVRHDGGRHQLRGQSRRSDRGKAILGEISLGQAIERCAELLKGPVHRSGVLGGCADPKIEIFSISRFCILDQGIAAFGPCIFP